MDQLKHGAWVQLEGCAECKYRLPPLCCLLDRGEVLLSLTAEGAPGQQLRIGPGCSADFRGGRGRWARFEARPALHDPNLLNFVSAGHLEQGHLIYLSLHDDGLSSSNHPLDSTCFSVRAVACSPEVSPEYPPSTSAPPFQLGVDALRRFAAEGYLLLPSLVSRDLVDGALREINATLGAGAAAWGEDENGRQVFDFSTQTTHFSHMSHTHFPHISQFDSFFGAESFISPPRHPFLPYVAHPFSPYLRI